VYIGNLSFYTTEAQIYELCSRAGPVKRVVMGLNRHTKTPCGFCFVEHFTAEAALECVGRVTGLVLDDRIVRAELDFGFRDGRQYGRGQSGGQVRDDRRMVYDGARSATKPATSAKGAIVPAEADDPDKAEQRKRRFAAMAGDDDGGGPGTTSAPAAPDGATTASAPAEKMDATDAAMDETAAAAAQEIPRAEGAVDAGDDGDQVGAKRRRRDDDEAVDEADYDA